MIEIDFSKKKLWFCIGLFAILVSVLGAVIVYGGSATANRADQYGHSAEEISEVVATSDWPDGAYCIMKRGECPNSFEAGSLEIRQNDNYAWDTEGKASGTNPDNFIENDDDAKERVILNFCCKDGLWEQKNYPSQ